VQDSQFRSIFVGGVKLIEPLLQVLIEKDFGLQAIFCPSAKSCTNSDFMDARTVIKDRLPCHVYDDINSENNIKLLRSYRPTVIYVIGISQIVKKRLLDIPIQGVLGGHISKLPENRGSNPIIWTIANGLKESALSLIWLDSGIDSGAVAEQREFKINNHENAGDVYEKVGKLYAEIFEDSLLPSFHVGHFPSQSQKNSNHSNRWRRRRYEDGVVDWRMSARRIHNLVRALYHPYPGASFINKNIEYKIWKSEIRKANPKYEPGRILEINTMNNTITVKAGEDAICLVDHSFDIKIAAETNYLS
jgi:methionyl-tRNA formyltransferase